MLIITPSWFTAWGGSYVDRIRSFGDPPSLSWNWLKKVERVQWYTSNAHGHLLYCSFIEEHFQGSCISKFLPTMFHILLTDQTFFDLSLHISYLMSPMIVVQS